MTPLRKLQLEAAAEFFGKTVEEWLTPSPEEMSWDGNPARGVAYKDGFRRVLCNQTAGEIDTKLTVARDLMNKHREALSRLAE